MPHLFTVLLSVMLLAGCSMESTDRSDEPLSRAEASKFTSLLLPASAKDVYFVTHAEGLRNSAEFLRFSVDPAEMDSTIETLLAGHTGSAVAYSPKAEEPFRPMSWWTPNSIVHGHHRTGEGQPIYIWTDTDNHIIFVFRSD